MSVKRLRQMTSGSRVLVLLTDGHDRGSQGSLKQAIAAAQDANVVVYAIAVGASSDVKPLTALASATGGRRFKAAEATGLGAAYDSLGRELDRTWQLSYLSAAREGDVARLRRPRCGRGVRRPRSGSRAGTETGALCLAPSRGTRSPAAIVVGLAALLFAVAGAAGRRRRRSTEITRLLEPHLRQRELADERPTPSDRFESLLGWTERSLNDLPGSQRLTRALERSGLKLRAGLVPYLANRCSASSSVPSARSSAHRPRSPLLLMLVGLAVPVHRPVDRGPAPHEGLRPAAAGRPRDDRLDPSSRSRLPDGAGCDRRRRRLALLRRVRPGPG